MTMKSVFSLILVGLIKLYILWTLFNHVVSSDLAHSFRSVQNVAERRRRNGSALCRPQVALTEKNRKTELKQTDQLQQDNTFLLH